MTPSQQPAVATASIGEPTGPASTPRRPREAPQDAPVGERSPATNPLTRDELIASLEPQRSPRRDARLGTDAFGDRTPPKAPEFTRGYDYKDLHADKRGAFFDLIDLRNPPPSRDALKPRRLPSDESGVTAGVSIAKSGVPPLLGSTGPFSKNQKVPHIVHSIWMGGPLRDAEFKRNVETGAARNPGFRFVLWTDVSRAEITAARQTPRSNREAAVKEMVDWADRANVRLVNIDEVFTSDNPMRFDAEARADRSRRTGTGYAPASDILRLEILNRFGGMYVDGDNEIVGQLTEVFHHVASDPNGLAIGRTGALSPHLTNSTIIAAAGSKGIREYLDITGDNAGKPMSALFPEFSPSNLTGKLLEDAPRNEIIRRTGPDGRTFERLAERLNIPLDEIQDRRRHNLPAVPYDVVVSNSAKAWLDKPQTQPTDDQPSSAGGQQTSTQPGLIGDPPPLVPAQSGGDRQPTPAEGQQPSHGQQPAPTANQRPGDQQPIDGTPHDPADSQQPITGQQPVPPAGQAPASHQPEGQPLATQQPANQPHAGQHPVNQPPAGQQPVNLPVGQRPAVQPPAGQQSTSQAPAGQQSTSQAPADQRSASQAPVDQRSASQAPADQRSASHPASQQPASQQPAPASGQQPAPVSGQPGPTTPAPVMDERTVIDAVKGAVQNLHREHAARHGVVHLASAKRAIDKLPVSQRPAAWDATIDLFLRDRPDSVTHVSLYQASGVPDSVVDRITAAFPDSPVERSPHSRSAPPPGTAPQSTPQTTPTPSNHQPQHDPAWGRSTLRSAPWFTRSDPLPPRSWESLRAKATVRKVDFTDIGMVRDATRTNPDYVHGTVRYDVRLMEVEPGRLVQEYTVRLHLVPKKPVTPDQVTDMKDKARLGVDALFNQGYRLPSGPQLHVRLEFVDTPGAAHVVVDVENNNRANEEMWGTRVPPVTLAHEVGHYLGLPDEYRDRGRDYQRVFNSGDPHKIVYRDANGDKQVRYEPRLNNVREGDGGIMSTTSHSTPVVLPRYLWMIDRMTTSQVHLPVSEHATLHAPSTVDPTPTQSHFDQQKSGRPRHEPDTTDRDLATHPLTPDEITDVLRAEQRATPTPSPLGKDVFGDRVAPPAPDWAHGFDYTGLHADKRAAFFSTIDMTKPHFDAHPPAGSTRPSLDRLDEAKVTTGKWTSADTRLGPKRRKIPHLVHSIWLGGPLFPDSGPRSAFMDTVAQSRRNQPDFDFVVWTDVPRAEVEAVRGQDVEQLTGRAREVAGMLEWARENGIRLVNVDEVFTAESPMRFDAEVRAERSRRNGSGYAAASDLLRLEVLDRFGGVYTDGDNLVHGDLAGTVQRIAGEPFGLGVSLDRDNRVNNSAFIAVAKAPGTGHLLDIIGGNVSKSYVDIVAGSEGRGPAVTGDVFPPATRDRIEETKNARNETIFRTGPDITTFDELARRAGIKVDPKLGRTKDTFPSVPDDVVRVESAQSWLSPVPAAVDGRKVLDTVKGAVADLHRDFASRPGVLLVPSAAKAIDALPAAQRVPAWLAALDLLELDPADVRVVSAKYEFQPSGSTQQQTAYVELPPEVRARLTALFGGARFVLGPERVDPPEPPDTLGDQAAEYARVRSAPDPDWMSYLDDLDAAAPRLAEQDAYGFAAHRRDVDVHRIQVAAEAGEVIPVRGTTASLVPRLDGFRLIGAAVTAELAADLAAITGRDVVAQVIGGDFEEPRTLRFPPRGRPLPG
ncbi:glycosyltransferase [Actinokineospora fastidiosa]|nr:glycosyltransferase [Actinokineospora fastidiosa]